MADAGMSAVGTSRQLLPGGRHGGGGGGGYGGGYYVAPPVIYGGDYAPGYAYEPDYYPPPVVYGPGIGINVGPVGIRIR